jgi:hypothetical protein
LRVTVAIVLLLCALWGSVGEVVRVVAYDTKACNRRCRVGSLNYAYVASSGVQLRCASGQVGSKDGLIGCPLVCTINGLKESNVEVALEDSNYK